MHRLWDSQSVCSGWRRECASVTYAKEGVASLLNPRKPSWRSESEAGCKPYMLGRNREDYLLFFGFCLLVTGLRLWAGKLSMRCSLPIEREREHHVSHVISAGQFKVHLIKRYSCGEQVAYWLAQMSITFWHRSVTVKAQSWAEVEANRICSQVYFALEVQKWWLQFGILPKQKLARMTWQRCGRHKGSVH